MAKSRNHTRDYLEYLAVRLIVCLGQMMTVEQSYAFAHGLAWLAYTFDKRHRIVGLENLQHAFGDAYDDADRDRIVRQVYEHFCMMVMEILHIPRQAAPDHLARSDHAGRTRGGAGSSRLGRADDLAVGPLRQLGDGGLSVRRLRFPAEFRRANAR